MVVRQECLCLTMIAAGIHCGVGVRCCVLQSCGRCAAGCPVDLGGFRVEVVRQTLGQ